ncbi:MAG: hypothetical protein KAQ66_04265, partial [Rhodospirillaceae bacterium]|nr:hypothetical protein [Rhodospirillaceae bacterium]
MASFFIAVLYLLFIPIIFLANPETAHADDQLAQASTDVERTIEAGLEDLELAREAMFKNMGLDTLEHEV